MKTLRWKDPVVDLDREWSALRDNRDPAARTRIIGVHMPFARMLAAKTYGRAMEREIEFEDFLQLALIGLIEAVDRFDHRLGVKFEAYAASRIIGSILNGLESMSERHEQISARRQAINARSASLGETPNPGETKAVFEHLVDVALGLAIGFLLEDTGYYQPETAGYADNSYQRVELRQLRARLHQGIGTLPNSESKVIRYHYFQQMPFNEIAQLLGLSNGRISQLHKSGMVRLRDMLGEQNRAELLC